MESKVNYANVSPENKELKVVNSPAKAELFTLQPYQLQR